MSQRSITSFFSKIPSTKKNSETDTGAGSISDGKVSEDSSPKNGKINGDSTLKKSKPEKSPLQKKVEKALKSPKPKSTEKPKKRESKTSANKIEKVVSKLDKEKSEKIATSDKNESETVSKSDKENKSSSSEESENVKPAKKQKRDKETSRIGGKKRRKIIEPSDSSSEEETSEKKIRLSNESNEVENDKNDTKFQKPETDGKQEENEKSLAKTNGEIKNEDTENEPNENKDTSNIEEKEKRSLNDSTEANETNAEKKEDIKKDNDEEKKTIQASLVMFGTSTKEKSKSSDQNEVGYDPSKDKYNPVDDACWKKSESVPYSALASTWSQIEAVSARLKIADILCNYFRSVIVLSPDDLLPSVYLCLNRLAPAHEGLELGIAETHLMKAICQSTGRTVAQLKSELHTLGDLGLVAERSRTNQRTLFSFRPARLTVRAVHAALKEVATMGGHASVQRKVDKIRGMMVACDKTEARYLTRSLAGKLRIGLAEQTVLQALAAACTRTPPGQEYPPKILDASVGVSSETFKKSMDEAILAIRTTCCECPDYGLIIPALLEGGISELSTRCPMKPGIPLKPMLAHPTKGVSEVLQRFEGMRFTCEWKYDGERAQIHRGDDGTVRIYSRNQEDNTTKYPDIINRLDKCIGEGVKSFILDCESVAWNKEGDGHILPFQVLSTRKRKGASEADIQVQVCVFMFDLLYFNGEPLVRKPLKERRDLLKKYFKESPGEWAFASARDTSTVDEIQEFLDESVKGNCEGLMVKTLEVEATYEIARRSRNWLKLKKDYLDGVGDTLDLVVLGGYLGKGKRTGTYGGFLLGCYDKENEEYQSICKIGTGFTDTDLKTLTDALKPHVIETAKPYYRYDGNHEPDHWFDTVQVWEVKCADLSLSPVHRAALGIIDPEKGISLRFPRFVKVRDDKTAEEATSARQVADMYSNQDQIKNQAKTSGTTAEEDFY